jgi:hypothetical protein
MGNSGKIITIVIVVFVGVFALAFMQKAAGGGIGFFGLFGVTIFFLIKSLFKKDKSNDNNSIEHSPTKPKEVMNSAINNDVYLTKKETVKEETTTKDNQEFTKEQIISAESFKIAVNGVSKLESEFRDLPLNGNFEAIIFNSLQILSTIEEIKPDLYFEIEQIYLYFLIKQSQTLEIPMDIDELGDFINQRFVFYDSELKNLSNIQGYTGSKIYTAFYLNPLSNEPENSFNLVDNIKFLLVADSIIKNLRKEVITLINNTL